MAVFVLAHYLVNAPLMYFIWRDYSTLTAFIGVIMRYCANKCPDLHRALLARLKDFLIELGRDFCFVGSEFPVQVGRRDFALDLLFFHRALNCLVAIELKVDRFEPEYLGKLGFYLEALDRAASGSTAAKPMPCWRCSNCSRKSTPASWPARSNRWRCAGRWGCIGCGGEVENEGKLDRARRSSRHRAIRRMNEFFCANMPA